MGMMAEEDFVDLVKQAEHEAKSSPSSYAVKLALFAALGYFFIFFLLLLLLALVGGVVATAFFNTTLFIVLLTKKLVIVIVAGIWFLLRALWVKFTPPQGLRLKRGEYPELFSEIDNLSKRLQALKIHEVLLDRSLNAAVMQHPRLGVIGWQKNYLLLGYQLLLTLSPQEMRSVLAHEFGHLSSNHGRFSGWIYRVRMTWARVLEAFERVESWGAALMRRFFDWYAPRFNAYSFVLARRNEYEADAMAAELTSPEVVSRALVKVYATAPYLDQSYWDGYFQQADDNPKPPYPPFGGLASFLNNNPLAREQLQGRVDTEMAVETHYADTHPSLQDRLRELGGSPKVPESTGASAAEAWFGERNRQLEQALDQEWLNENSDSWSHRYQYVSNAKEQLQRFSQTQPTDLGDQELWNYAYWTQEFDSSEAALPLFRAYQERHPQDPDPAFFIGNTLLGQGDADGLAQLRLARKSPDLIERAALAGYRFLNEQGKAEEAETWWRECADQNKLFIAAQKEREGVSDEDPLVSPEMGKELLQQLIENLKQQKKVGKAWLAEKVVRHLPEHPVYVIAFDAKGFNWSRARVQSEVAKELDVPGTFFVVCKTGWGKPMAKKVIKAGKRIL